VEENKMMIRLLPYCIFILLLFDHSIAFGQCCSAGNPFFYSEQTNPGRKELQVVAGYKYSISETYYEGSEKISIDFVDKAYFNYLNLQLVYGLTPRISLQTDLGYFLNKTETYSLSDWQDSKGYGLGDAALTIKYLAYKNFIRKIAITPSIGMKFPIGVFDQEADHVKLPITVQPSSGSYKYLINLSINKSFKHPKWNLGFFGSFEYAQLIDSENFYYKYGNMYLFSMLTSYKVSKAINLGLEIRSENRGKSKRENEHIVESSGYKIIYAIPHVSYSFAKKWFLAVNGDLPVYKYYNGIQLANKFAMSARITYNISCARKLVNDLEIK
jgi:hypothetical protein